MENLARVCLFCLALLGQGWALAGDKPVCPRPLRVGLYDAGLLYDAKTATGINRDIVDALAKRTGCRFDTTVYPRVRIWPMLEAGELDLTVSGLWTQERERYGLFAYYGASKNYSIVANRTPASVDSWAAFMADKSLTMGVVRSFRYEAFFEAQIAILKAEGRVGEVGDNRQLFSDLGRGRWNMVLSQPVTYPSYIRPGGLAESVRIVDWAPQVPATRAGLVFTRKHFDAAEVAKWQAVLNAMRKDGTLRAIYSTYLNKADVEDMLKF